MGTVGMCLENIEIRIPEILAEFSRAHPSVTVNINGGDTQNLASMLADSALDMAVLTISGGVAYLKQERLLHEQPLVWATHSHSQRVAERPLQLAIAPIGCPRRNA